MFIPDPGTDFYPIPDAGSGSRGQKSTKNTGSRIRNTDLQMDPWSKSTYYQTDGIRPCGILKPFLKAVPRHVLQAIFFSIFIHLMRGAHRRKSTNDRGGKPEQKFSYVLEPQAKLYICFSLQHAQPKNWNTNGAFTKLQILFCGSYKRLVTTSQLLLKLERHSWPVRRTAWWRWRKPRDWRGRPSTRWGSSVRPPRCYPRTVTRPPAAHENM
jgi:hypothetical protein